jgi:hypothetical protein
VDDLLAVIADTVQAEADKRRSEATRDQRAGDDKKLSRPEPQPQKLPEKHHANTTPTKAAELFNTNRTTSPVPARITGSSWTSASC